MSKKDFKKYFDVLELSSDASFVEVKKAYLRLKKLYSSDSIVISPIEDEFSVEERQKILRQIEEAYLKIIELFRDSRENFEPFNSSFPSESGNSEADEKNISYSGPVLKRIREKKGIQLFEVALDTKIRHGLLENIELEIFESLPHEAYLKAHVMNYARYLLLNPHKVADDYLKRYRAWKMANPEEG